ncbi:MAG: hypothetical protein EU536_01550 [Promethearchaeota archaeon]|nr:MAG: hypothetical protein EU536_01550 [Candidatus Lokiarchaeota archaeon]
MTAEKNWTDKERLLARFISWGIIISVVLLICGGIWTTLEILIAPSSSSIGAWFLAQDWTIKVLIIGALIVGVLLGLIVFSVFIRKGQRFILNLLFKIEE